MAFPKTSSRLATNLDSEFLRARGFEIAPAFTADAMLMQWQGQQLAQTLAGRLLCRYLLPAQVQQLPVLATRAQYLTPTAYSAKELASWLTLPNPQLRRQFVILIDPAQLATVIGPRWVALGGGIEFIALQGIPRTAIVDVAPAPPGGAIWPVEVA